MRDGAHVGVHVRDLDAQGQRPDDLRVHLGAHGRRNAVQAGRLDGRVQVPLRVQQAGGRVAGTQGRPAVLAPLAGQGQVHAQVRVREFTRDPGRRRRPRAGHHDRRRRQRASPEQVQAGTHGRLTHAQVVRVKDHHAVVRRVAQRGQRRVGGWWGRWGHSRPPWRAGSRAGRVVGAAGPVRQVPLLTVPLRSTGAEARGRESEPWNASGTGNTASMPRPAPACTPEPHVRRTAQKAEEARHARGRRRASGGQAGRVQSSAAWVLAGFSGFSMNSVGSYRSKPISFSYSWIFTCRRFTSPSTAP
ncbi:hypothetical protein Daqu01_02657 [Deinococcus aquaticus]